MDQTELPDFLLNVVEARHLSYAIAGSHASMAAAFVSPEDVILKKMEAFEEGKSEKHLRDIAGILKTMGGRIDRQYIDEWAPRLNVGHVWTEVVRRFPGSESRPER